MARNIEIKARLLDLQAAERTAYEVGGLPQVLRQVDTYFHCTHGRLKLREFEEGAAELIRYQRSDEAGPRCSQYQLLP
ncbi:MAG: adenylate cyclase, partial [Planctomycetota bacterium]